MCVLSVSPQRLLAQSDEPDLKREKRLHEIYLKYNQNPISDQTWAGATSGKAQTYQVQKGDTLWDLSSTLFGQPDFWPKVWSLNNEKVQNPHEILPQQVIQFYPGTLGEAPSLAVTDGKAAPAPAVESPLATKAPTPQKLVEDPNPPELPENLRNPKPVSALPDSLPKWKYRSDVLVDTEFETTGERKVPPTTEFLPYYLSQGLDEAAGQITETEMGGKVAADFQYIYVKLPKELTEKRLLVVKDLGKVKDPSQGESASLIEAQGEIEVLDVVNSNKSIYRAIVKKAILPIEVGSKLVPGKIPTFSVDETPQVRGLAKVVGGEYAVRRELLGNRALIFLSGKGLDEGKTYPIYKVQQKRNEDTDDISNDRQIGRVKVIQVSGGFATAVILESREDIHVGDVTDPEVNLR